MGCNASTKSYRLTEEKKIDVRLRKEFTQMGCQYVKLNPSQNNGIPDRMVLMPNGKTLFIELKSINGKPRPMQTWWQKQLLSTGHNHEIINELTPEILRVLIAKYLF